MKNYYVFETENPTENSLFNLVENLKLKDKIYLYQVVKPNKISFPDTNLLKVNLKRRINLQTFIVYEIPEIKNHKKAETELLDKIYRSMNIVVIPQCIIKAHNFAEVKQKIDYLPN